MHKHPIPAGNLIRVHDRCLPEQASTTFKHVSQLLKPSLASRKKTNLTHHTKKQHTQFLRYLSTGLAAQVPPAASIHQPR